MRLDPTPWHQHRAEKPNLPLLSAEIPPPSTYSNYPLLSFISSCDIGPINEVGGQS
jgi:hypothetical protein